MKDAPSSYNDQALLKKKAAEYAVEFVQSGMVLGLGTGSTTQYALELIGQRIQSGQLKDVVGMPSSLRTEDLAHQWSIPLITFETHTRIDVTIDGADEVDPQLNLIKGGGGALLREKILAQASRRNIIIVDETKLSPQLGTQWPVPVEVLPFAWHLEAKFLSDLGASAVLRTAHDKSAFKTDQGNFVLDCNFGILTDPHTLASRLNQRAAIMEHGLFLDLATDVIVAGVEGVRHLKR